MYSVQEKQKQVDIAVKHGLPDEMIQLMAECVETAAAPRCLAIIRKAYQEGVAMKTIRRMADVVKRGRDDWTAEALRFADEGGYSEATCDRLYATALEEYGDAVFRVLYYPLKYRKKELYIKRLTTARIRSCKIYGNNI